MKDYCPGLTHVGAIPVFPAEAATTLEDEDVSDSEVRCGVPEWGILVCVGSGF